MEAAAQYFSWRLTTDATVPLGEEAAHECVTAVRTAIGEVAQSVARSPRDFACTFLGAVVTDGAALLFQVGDGAVVFDGDAGLEAAVWPMVGEYANTTYFVSDEDALNRLCVRTVNRRISRLALFTDGVQRIALNFAAKAPHEPFFAPLFAVLDSASEDQAEALDLALAQFLASAEVNASTDDDKTLVLATRPR